VKRWGWRTRDDGMVIVHDLPDGPERAPMLSPAEAPLMDAIEEKWGAICRTHGRSRGIPDGWLQAMIYQESKGDPRARNAEGTPDPGNDGIGLFQITHPSLKGRRQVEIDGAKKWVGGLSDSQLMVPDTNAGIAAKHVQYLIKLVGPSFPEVAAAFNAGSVRPPQDAAHENPWWMHSTGNHITIEVMALNYWLATYGPEQHFEAPTDLIFLVDLAREADDEARRDTEPPTDAA